MKNKDIKFLWGRSGNRCTLCKLELTPDGEKETLGEMAHIVGRSADGPRGDASLAIQDRDNYSNLILLCPTHHRQIDKSPDDWPIERVLQAKRDHETWVSQMLQDKEITVAAIDNSEFVDSCLDRWSAFCGGGLGLAAALTPLRVIRHQVDPLETTAQAVLESAAVVGSGFEPSLNRYKTRPTEFGLCNERPRNPDGLDGYSFHIFDSGHCEAVYTMSTRAARFEEISAERSCDIHGATKQLRYTDLAESIIASLQWFITVWHNVLPFEYMDLRVSVLAASGLTIYAYESDWREGVFGYPATSDTLMYQEVLRREEFQEEVFLLPVLQWLTRCFGLQLHATHDAGDEVARPVPFR